MAGLKPLSENGDPAISCSVRPTCASAPAVPTSIRATQRGLSAQRRILREMNSNATTQPASARQKVWRLLKICLNKYPDVKAIANWKSILTLHANQRIQKTNKSMPWSSKHHEDAMSRRFDSMCVSSCIALCSAGRKMQQNLLQTHLYKLLEICLKFEC